MGNNWMVAMLVLAAYSPYIPMVGAQALEKNPTVREIEAGCHRLIQAHECQKYLDALSRTPAEGHERILEDYLATVLERQSACRCDLAEVVGLPPR